ncbi:MAG: MBL fold metallo-hydrolase [Candidatus Eisenbacteria bacterium]|nr:MBL fold metallo-hydrolase [Candidatus Eisenbacteria bacterium]
MLQWTVHDAGPGVLLKSAAVGFADANCYILGCARTLRGAVIDPGTDVREQWMAIVDEALRNSLKIERILNTHGHPDHFAGNDLLRRAFGAEVAIHEFDGLKLSDSILNSSKMFGLDVRATPADQLLKDGQELAVGDVTLTVLHTPGHSLGGVAFLGPGFVLTGDTLFAGSVGRTDLPASSRVGTDAWEVLAASIREKLLTLPDDTLVLPGHGPATTIGTERKQNQYLR